MERLARNRNWHYYTAVETKTPRITHRHQQQGTKLWFLRTPADGQAASAAAMSLGFAAEDALGLKFPTTEEHGTGDAYDIALSDYYHRIFTYACRKVKL